MHTQAFQGDLEPIRWPCLAILQLQQPDRSVSGSVTCHIRIDGMIDSFYIASED